MKLSEQLATLIEERGWEYECAELITRAIEVVKKFEEAPSGECWQHAYIGGQRTSSIIITREPEDGLAVIGKRVRIVEE